MFQIVVGGAGGVGCPDGCPGLNGGGPSGAAVGGGASGSGGGGSDVRAGSCAVDLTCTFGDRIVVGGGGGGLAVWTGDFNSNVNCFPTYFSRGGQGGGTIGATGGPPTLFGPCHGPFQDPNSTDLGSSQTDPGPGGAFGRGAGYGGGDGGGGGGGWFGGGSGQYSGGGGGSGHVDPVATSSSMQIGAAPLGDGKLVIYKG